MQSFAYVGQKPPKIPIFTQKYCPKTPKTFFTSESYLDCLKMPHKIYNYDYLSSFGVPIQNYDCLDKESGLKPSIFGGQRSQYAKHMQFGF